MTDQYQCVFNLFCISLGTLNIFQKNSIGVEPPHSHRTSCLCWVVRDLHQGSKGISKLVLKKVKREKWYWASLMWIISCQWHVIFLLSRLRYKIWTTGIYVCHTEDPLNLFFRNQMILAITRPGPSAPQPWSTRYRIQLAEVCSPFGLVNHGFW